MLNLKFFLTILKWHTIILVQCLLCTAENSTQTIGHITSFLFFSYAVKNGVNLRHLIDNWLKSSKGNHCLLYFVYVIGKETNHYDTITQCFAAGKCHEEFLY